MKTNYDLPVPEEPRRHSSIPTEDKSDAPHEVIKLDCGDVRNTLGNQNLQLHRSEDVSATLGNRHSQSS